MRKLNSMGFGAIEILLALIVIGILGGVSWYVWHGRSGVSKTISSFQDCVDHGNPVMDSYPQQCSANGKTYTDPVQAAQAAQGTKLPVSNIPQDTSKYLEIKEWGVRGKFSGSQTLTYSFDSGNLIYAKISTEELKKTDADCASGSYWAIARGKAGQYVGESDTPIDKHPKAIKVGNYYYEYESAQANCTSSASTKIQQTGMAETEALVQTLESFTSN